MGLISSLTWMQAERLFSKRLQASSLDELGFGVFGDNASWHVEFTFKWYPTVAGEQTNCSYTATRTSYKTRTRLTARGAKRIGGPLFLTP
jgi:hypothetical protein